MATFDGSTARLYVNGALAGSTGATYALNTQRPLRMASGATDRAPDYFLPGRVDEVAVYGSALAAARVQAHYTAGTSGGGGGNQPPTATILTPTAGTTWKVGDTIAFSGSASDPQEGTLPASSLSWALVLQHCPSNCHQHQIQTWNGVASGSFSAPDHDYPSHLELHLTATDAQGASGTTFVRLDPQTVLLSFQTSPSGLQLTSGSSSGTTPFTREVIRGSANTLSAASPQTLNGTTYAFSAWSDGGAQTHTITANAPATYTATYAPGGGGTSYSATVLQDSPLAYWRLGETSGTTAADSSGANRSGSYLASPSLNQPGALVGDTNRSVGFNGSSQYVNVPYLAALNPAQVTVGGMGVPDGRAGDVPLGRDEPRLRNRQRPRVHPVRRLRQHLAVLARHRHERVGHRARAGDRLEPVDAPAGDLRRVDRPPVRERRARGLHGSDLRTEHAAATADGERRHRSRPRLLPARPRGRGRGLRERPRGGARAGALHGGYVGRGWWQSAADRGRLRIPDQRAGALDRRLQRQRFERPGRDDRLLRLGPGRGRSVRRLDRRAAVLPVHGRRDVHRAPARHRQRRAVGRLRPAHHHRHLGRRGDELQRHRPPGLPARLLAPGRDLGDDGRRLERREPKRLVPGLAVLEPAGSTGRRHQPLGRLQRLEPVRERALSGGAQPCAGDGGGVGVPDGRAGDVPLGRDEPRLRNRQRPRVHPVRRLRQHLAVLARHRHERVGHRARAGDRLEPVDAPASRPSTGRPPACT